MALQKFNSIKQKRILICVKNNLDSYQSNWAREISINLTDFLLHRFSSKQFDIFIGKDEDELLQTACQDNFYTNAVVIACGTSLGLSDRIFEAIEECCTKDFFIAGHLLDRTKSKFFHNACYELHHQFYIVNLNEYRELGCPTVGSEEWHSPISLTEPVRSEEYLCNDPEIPLWVKKGTVLKQYDMKLHGWNIINCALENNKKIIDIGPNIRNSKKYFYYEYDHVFHREISLIHFNSFLCHNMFSPFNSDQLRETFNFPGKLEQYVTVGIGLHWIYNLYKIGYHPDRTTVIFTDINQNCLKFMRTLVEEWDGEDFISLYRKYLDMIPNSCMFDPNSDEHLQEWEKEINEFKSKFIDWSSQWKQIKKLKFQYVLTDYLSVYNLNWLQPNKNTLMNLSDLFNHVPFVATRPLKYRILSENKLIECIKNVDPNIVLLLTSRAADGFWRENKDSEFFDTVDCFELTDLEKLKTPEWHLQDWKKFKPPTKEDRRS